MRSKFSIAGHPIHPALVVIPIGLFIWAFVADLAYLGTDDKMWYDIAFWAGIAGVASALVAALPGFGDFMTMARHSDARGMAMAHGILNVVVVALFGVAALLMIDEGALDGASRTAVVIMHAVGVGLLALSGWLGGELVFRHHLAVVPDDQELAAAEHARHDREEASGRAGRPRRA